jgi:YVTN family beta-propeller protein
MIARRLSITLTVLAGLVAPVVASGPSPATAATSCAARAFVVNQGDDNVSVIDVATDSVVGSPVGVGENPNRVATSPDGTRAYVTDTNTGTLSVIDTATGTVVGAIPIGGPVLGIAGSPDGHTAYVSQFFMGSVVTVVDLDHGTDEGDITVGGGRSVSRSRPTALARTSPTTWRRSCSRPTVRPRSWRTSATTPSR